LEKEKEEKTNLDGVAPDDRGHATSAAELSHLGDLCVRERRRNNERLGVGGAQIKRGVEGTDSEIGVI